MPLQQVSLNYKIKKRRQSFKNIDLLSKSKKCKTEASESKENEILENSKLHFSSLKKSFSLNCPIELVCRESQIQELSEFVEHHIENKIPASLYISGAPGTGKTACVKHVISNIKAANIPIININCMALKNTTYIYEKIASELKIKKKSDKNIVHLIENSITKSLLLILDEMDQLESKYQQVLYTIFEWPALTKSKLVLIGIANALDLTDRILPRLQAITTCCPRLMHFAPYSKKDICDIIYDRINKSAVNQEILKTSAIHFLGSKVASVDGDARKALDVCRRAVELCEISGKADKQVDVPMVLSILNQVYGSESLSVLKNSTSHFPLQQKLIVCSILLMTKSFNQMQFYLGQVLLRINSKGLEEVLGDNHLLSSVLQDKESLGRLCKMIL